MQLSAALEFAMEAPQLVVVHHKLWKYAASSGVPPDDAAIVQLVYHLLDICCRSTTCSILWCTTCFTGGVPLVT